MVDINDGEYQKGLMENQFSVIGRIFGQNKVAMPTMMELQKTLSLVWKISNFRIIPISIKLYHILLNTLEE